jgi:hypothetical protein
MEKYFMILAPFRSAEKDTPELREPFVNPLLHV